jgi:hypothetical protein
MRKPHNVVSQRRRDDEHAEPASRGCPGLAGNASSDVSRTTRERFFPKSTTWSYQDIPFDGHPVFEVDSYVLDRDGGHVTFDRGGEGTFVVYGGGRIEPVQFPYPHAMFEVVGEAETLRIKSQRRAARQQAHRPGKWLSRLWPWVARVANA